MLLCVEALALLVYITVSVQPLFVRNTNQALDES
jgi:hypothetical protein